MDKEYELEKKLPVTLTLFVEEWQEVIAGLTGQSFNGREQAERLNNRISAIVAANVQSYRENKPSLKPRLR